MEILKTNKKNIIKIIKAIKKRKIVILPTDTVYGIICDATNKKAVERIFKIKKRNKNKPLPIFVKNIKMAKELASIKPWQEKILRKYWPGKFTFILQGQGRDRGGTVPLKGTIGLRIPKYKLVNELLKKINKPLTGTSANISGKPASTKIKEVLKQFLRQKTQPDIIIDAGNLKKSKPSKVIDLTKDKPKVLRD